jgi:Tol biopolymer transport system component
MQGRVLKAAMLIATATALVLPAAATAAYPGSNGRIFFNDGGAIFSIRPDGSDRQRVVDPGREPAVSADGNTIVFTREGDIYTASRSGGNVNQVTTANKDEMDPSFSPNGNKILFATASVGGKTGQIFTVRAEGGDRTRLTKAPRSGSEPEYSPNGDTIVFSRALADAPLVDHLFLIDADGGNLRQLTSGDLLRESPTWSPDGNRIAFSGLTGQTAQIFAANADGTGLLQPVTGENSLGDREPAFAPSGDKLVFRGERNDRNGLFVVGTTGIPVIEEVIANPFPGDAGRPAGIDPYWAPSP